MKKKKEKKIKKEGKCLPFLLQFLGEGLSQYFLTMLNYEKRHKVRLPFLFN